MTMRHRPKSRAKFWLIGVALQPRHQSRYRHTQGRIKSMTGHIRRRGKQSWEIKFDLGTDHLSGKRMTRYHSFKGTKREAEAEIVRLKAGADRGEYVDPSKVTLAQFLDRWEEWAAGQVSAKTLERYMELTKLHVRPHLGAMRLQKLRTVNFAELYGKLQKPKDQGGAALGPRTVGHLHRLMHRVLGHAVKWSLDPQQPRIGGRAASRRAEGNRDPRPRSDQGDATRSTRPPALSDRRHRTSHRNATWRASRPSLVCTWT